MTETDLPPEPIEEARNPIGWIALGLLLLLSLTFLISGFKPSNKGVSGGASLATGLRYQLASRVATERLGIKSSAGLETLVNAADTRRKLDPEAAAYWTVLETELRKPVGPADLALFSASKDEKLRNVALSYGRPISKPAAETLARKLDGQGVLGRLAATHLREAEGIPGARAWQRTMADHFTAAISMFAILAAASLAAWFCFAFANLSGAVPSLGPPLTVQTLGEADRLAIRAAVLFAGFTAVGLLASLVPGIPKGVRSILAGAAMFYVVPTVLRWEPSFEQVVRAKEFFGRKVVLGLWAFLLEIPVTLIAAGIGNFIFRNLPQAEHPAAAALMDGQNILTIVSILFAGAVVAPFWEETMFRGLLFPALRKVLGGTAAAAILSSFLFACIHPQGPGGWIGLMAFAICSCITVSRTRSLVPSMVMHAAHNGTLLVFAILMGS